MANTWILHVGGLLWFATGALGSVPSVEDLLARYRENAEKYLGSFACKLEKTEDHIIRMVPDPTLRRGRTVWHESLDCRWDGRRLCIRRCSWGTNARGETIPQEDAVCAQNLFDLDREIHYLKQPKSRKLGHMTYGGRAPPRQNPMGLLGGISWGFFDSDNKPLDEYLRGNLTVRLRTQMDTVNGSQCYVLDVAIRSESRNLTIWIDPSHGYNVAKCESGSRLRGGRTTVSTVAFRQVSGAWVPVEAWSDYVISDPSVSTDIRYHDHTKVTEFFVHPDHEVLKSFVVDDIPDGTPVDLMTSDRGLLVGHHEWRKGGPMARVDKEVVNRLDALAVGLSPGAVPDSVLAADVASLRKKLRGPYSGLHCLYLAVKMSGQDPNYRDLLKPDYVDLHDGSSLSRLGQAAENARLYAKAVDRADSRMLRACPYPMILHVRGDQTSQKYDYYVLFLGSQAGRARICDPPESVREVSFAELESRWDGKVLVVSKSPIDLSAIIQKD